jgi:hypothetical protein
MKNKNVQIVLMSVALSLAVLLFWQYSDGDHGTYAATIMLIGGLFALFFAYRFLLAFFGRKEIKDEKENFPHLLSLENPMVSGVVRFCFELPTLAYVRLVLKPAAGGNEVVVTEGEFAAGVHPVAFDSSTITNGVYYYEFIAPKYKTSRKMIVNNA